MIHYQLRCDAEHGFDGWFRDSTAFDVQAGRGLVECPECGSVAVRRALMAPSLPRSAKAPPIVDQSGVPAPPAPPAETEPGKAAVAMPDKVRAVLQRLRAEVERNCEHVGDRFADEARRIHNGEVESRGIYGESTPDEVQALAEDGIEVSRLPWVPRADG